MKCTRLRPTDKIVVDAYAPAMQTLLQGMHSWRERSRFMGGRFTVIYADDNVARVELANTSLVIRHNDGLLVSKRR